MSVNTSYAQKEYSPGFRVSEGDLQNTFYEKDSTANALVIYEHGKSYVSEEDYSVITEYKKKIKILKKEGFDVATVKMYLYKANNKYQKLEDIEATTYTKVDGKVEITKLDAKNIYKEKYDEHYNLVKFAFPNVKVGSVITYSYTYRSPFIFNFKQWNFQEEIPKLYSKYETRIPAVYKYHIKLVGSQELDVNTSDVDRECITYGTGKAGCIISTYVMKNIPAFIEEDFMTTRRDYMSKIEYELEKTHSFDGTIKEYTKNWKVVDRQIKVSESLGKELKRTSLLKDLLPISIVNETDDLKKAQSIYNFVRSNYSWDDTYRVFEKISLKKLLKVKSGSVTDINVLLHNLLKKNGFDVNLIVLSTRDNGLPTKLFPVISEFNYSIVRLVLDGKEYLLDATDDFVVFGQIPFRCLNQYGRILDFKNGSDWFPIEIKKTSKTQQLLNLKFDTEKKLTGVLKTRYSGYHALQKKRDYFRNESSYVEDLESDLVNIELISHTINSKGIQDKNFQETIKLVIEDDDLKSDKIYFNPFVIQKFKENPFKLQERNYPVNFGYKDSYFYSLVLDVGDAYEILETPESIRMALSDNKGSFSFRSKKTGTKIQLNFNLSFKEAIYHPAYYDLLKQMMSKVVDVQTKSVIVLQKK